MKKTLALILCAVLLVSLSAAAFAADAPVTLKIGASSTPHGELLEIVKPKLEEKGIKLDIVIYDDYVLPNTALQDGTLDAWRRALPFWFPTTFPTRPAHCFCSSRRA